MDTLILDIGQLIVSFLGWVFFGAALALIIDRFCALAPGPIFRGGTFAGYGITWFAAAGNELMQRALQQDGVRLFNLGRFVWFWTTPKPSQRSTLRQARQR